MLTIESCDSKRVFCSGKNETNYWLKGKTLEMHLINTQSTTQPGTLTAVTKLAQIDLDPDKLSLGTGLKTNSEFLVFNQMIGQINENNYF